MSSLLFVGVLGGLTAPLPSEAGTPTLTFKVDSSSPVSILVNAASNCTTGANSETANGYTACYSILTGSTVYSGTNAAGSTRGYTIQAISAGSARLKVADTTGQDKLLIVGVKFVPVVANWATGTDTAGLAPNSTEEHNLTIVFSHTFDDPTANAAGNAGIYKWNVRTSGQFFTGPTGGAATPASAKKCDTTDGICDSLTDRTDFTGKGTFSAAAANTNAAILSANNSSKNPPSTKNQSPLSFTTTGTHSTSTAHLSWDGASNTTMGQVDPYYPEFTCTNATNGTDTTSANFCRPTVTLTMKAQLFGPDTFQVVNGGDLRCVKCSEMLTPNDASKIKFVTDGVKYLTNLEIIIPKLKPLLQPIIDLGKLFLSGLTTVKTDVNGAPCPGATVLAADVNKDIVAEALFYAQDPLNSPGTPAETGTITITKRTNEVTSDTFTFKISGPSSLTETITLGGTNTESIVVPVVVGTYDIGEINNPEGWSLNSSSCGLERPTTGVVVSVGGNVTCTFTNRHPVVTGGIEITKSAYLTGDPCLPSGCPLVNGIFDFPITGGPSPDQTPQISLTTGIDGTVVKTVSVSVIPGTYNVSEVTPVGWIQGATYCDSPPSSGASHTIEVIADRTVHCIFRNGFIQFH